MNAHTLCLCGSGIEYQHCCGPFHSGEKIPATAEALMRSRYTAYALRNAAYLQATWDATRRPEKIDFSREKIDWLRLEIIETKKGGIKDSKGVVVFKAFYRQDGEEHVMNEISRFTKINRRGFILMVSLNQWVNWACKRIRARMHSVLAAAARNLNGAAGQDEMLFSGGQLVAGVYL